MDYIFIKEGKQHRLCFRPYQDKDFPMYLQCIRAFYKDGYPYKKYLNQAYLQQNLQEGTLFLTVGELSDGNIISVSAASFGQEYFKNSILLMLRNVVPEYSGLGIASAQLNDMTWRLKGGYPHADSIYADVMTYNGVSQHSLDSRGYLLCGIRMMLYKNEIIAPGLDCAPGTKMSQAVYCRNLKQGITKRIYVPKEHKEMISSLYEKLAVSVITYPMEESCYEEENRWRVVTVKEHEKTEWMIWTLAKGFEKELEETFLEYEKMEHSTGLVYINMSSPSSGRAFRFFREHGFYFSGLKPLNQEGEYMILSHTARCSQKYEKIVLGTGGDALLQYILEHI